RTFLEGKRCRRRGFRLYSEDFDRWIKRFDGATNPSNQSATANAGDDGSRIWRVFKDFERHRPVTGNKIMIIERMNKYSVGPGKRTVLQRFPCYIVRDRNEFRAERFHSLDL